MQTRPSQLNTPLLTGNCTESKREELIRYFKNTWQTYESLFSQINKDEAYFLKPEPLRHPLIFYYGHTATFFINKLMLGKFIHQRVNQRLESICAVGVDEMSWDDLNTANYQWPTVGEVADYRNTVYKLILTLIETMELSLPIQQNSLAWIILMGCEHERIHLETSSVIMRMLPLEYLTDNSGWRACNVSAQAPKNEHIAMPAQTITLGKSADDLTYGWDNEYGELSVNVEVFKASKYLVTNEEFLTFVQAGGYQKTDYWTDEGQRWLAFKKPVMPVFWLVKNEEYFQRNLNGIIPLPLNWPVEVNYLEAKAFCNWKSEQTATHTRLPTEAEWYCLRELYQGDKLSHNGAQNLDKQSYKAQSSDTQNNALSNINLAHFASSCPVDYFQTQDEQFSDIVGNVWQWTESPIDGFYGFDVHPLYDDFSTPTFDGKHNLIKGGSWISTGNETIKSSRYAFRRHFFQHAGFRYIESENPHTPTTHVNQYETDFSVCQQLESHYGSDYFSVTNYPKALANVVNNAVKKFTGSAKVDAIKCLDLGCSVGRTTFELSTLFKHIDGVDFSARYIQHAVQLQNNERVRYTLKNEGDIVQFKETSLDDVNVNTINTIDFSQGDAANLKVKYNEYDVIIAQHVLEQSYDPALFLSSIHQRLNAKGLLIVTSDYSFNESITDKRKWIGGIKINGENVTGFDGLQAHLSSHFTLLDEQDLPKVLVNNGRQHIMSTIHITVWQLN